MKTDSELMAKFSNIYIMLLYSIMTKDIDRVKHFLSKDIYDENLKVIDKLKKSNESQMYDELNVSKIEIIKKEIIDNKELVTVCIISRYMDYVIDDQGNYKYGNNKERVEKENILVFSKLLTANEMNYYTCSNCGANLDINYTGVCPYCNSVCDISNYDYKLVKFDIK